MGKVTEKITGGKYESVIEATSEAAANASVSGTPILVIGGETVNPLSEPDRTRTPIEQMADEPQS